MNKLSYSAWKKYHMCPRMYKLHYIDRLRADGTTSALAFGTAIGGALEQLYLGKTKDVIKTFREIFTYEKHTDVEWDNKDFDIDLFTPDMYKKIADKDWGYQCWASMRVKGRLLLEQHMKYVHPKITKVYSVERDIKGRPGFLDLECEFDGYGHTIIDFKTASRPYDENSARESTQLALYAKHTGIKTAGFIVLNKQIRKDKKKTCRKCGFDGSGRQHATCFDTDKKGKRCGGAWDVETSFKPYVQVIIDKVDQTLANNIEDSIAQTEEAIGCGHFPRNYEACNWQYGRPCIYKKYCWNNDKTGLEHKPEEKKDE